MMFPFNNTASMELAPGDPGANLTTLEDEIACIRREIRQRCAVYPRLVLEGLMSEAEAQYEVALMARVLQRLEFLRAHRGSYGT
jgi:hypothetical protein